MREHVARIHALGMKYMLWYSVVYVGEYSKHWATFRSMLLRRDTGAHAGILDPRFPQVRVSGGYIREGAQGLGFGRLQTGFHR